MLALLKLVPVRDWLYAAVIAVLLAFFGWFTVHERDEGRAVILAADKKLADAVAEKNLLKEQAAQAASNQVSQVYEKAIAVPAVGDLGLVCHAPGSAPVSQGPEYRPDVTHKADIGSQGSFDPSGPILTLLRDDDAQIDGLIDTVELLTKESPR